MNGWTRFADRLPPEPGLYWLFVENLPVTGKPGIVEFFKSEESGSLVTYYQNGHGITRVTQVSEYATSAVYSKNPCWWMPVNVPKPPGTN